MRHDRLNRGRSSLFFPSLSLSLSVFLSSSSLPGILCKIPYFQLIQCSDSRPTFTRSHLLRLTTYSHVVIDGFLARYRWPARTRTRENDASLISFDIRARVARYQSPALPLSRKSDEASRRILRARPVAARTYYVINSANLRGLISLIPCVLGHKTGRTAPRERKPHRFARFGASPSISFSRVLVTTRDPCQNTAVSLAFKIHTRPVGRDPTAKSWTR